MLTKNTLMAGLTAGLLLGGLWSGTALADVDVKDPYSFVTSEKAMVGAAFMTIANTGEAEEKNYRCECAGSLRPCGNPFHVGK